jgi:hypothetical protein
MVKTKTWIVLVAALLLLSLSLSLWLLRPRADAAYAEVWSEGKLLYTLPLSVDQQITVTGHHGENVVTVKAGKIAVTAADCPDHYCMERGYCAGGTQIVCLPNRLVIRFVGEQKLDGIAG